MLKKCTFCEDLVFDVGLHKGQDAEFYLKKGFRVIGIEADPDLCRIVEDRLREYVDSGRLTIINAAIAAEAGSITLFKNNRISEWNTTKQEWEQRNRNMGDESSRIIVKSVKFSEIIDTYGCPYFLKIDIEGADMLCVEALKDYSIIPKKFPSNPTSSLGRRFLMNFGFYGNWGI